MKTREQIELFVFRACEGGQSVEFLLLLRTPGRGGFWQPLTGGVHVGETLKDCVVREAKEEIGVTISNPVLETGYSFTFTESGRSHSETVFCVEISRSESESIVLSDEHESYRWVSAQQALNLLKWDSNKTGLRRVLETIERPIS